MFNTLSIICSVALSIASTNDYRFTSPGTTNLVGRGMGPNAEYVVPRAEDIAFLREAWSERMCLLRGRYDGYDRPYIIPGGEVVAAGRIGYVFLSTNSVYDIFGPSFGNWTMTGHTGYGPHAQFVSPGLAVQRELYVTGPNYTINGESTEHTLKPFVGPSAAIPSSSLCTNVYFEGILASSRIAGTYSNIVANASVCSCIEDGLGAVNSWQHPQTKYYLIVRDVDKKMISYEDEEYTFTTPNGESVRSSYHASYTLQDQPDFEVRLTNDVDRIDSLKSAYISITATTVKPYDFKYNDRYLPKKYHSVPLESYHYGKSVIDRVSEGSSDFYVYSDILRQATNYVTEADCSLVLRFSIAKTEETSGSTQNAGTTTATTNHYVFTEQCKAYYVDANKWRIDFDLLKGIWPLFDRGWVGAVSYPVVDVLNPTEMDTVPQTLYATRTRTARLIHIDIYPFISFHPTFRARVL